MSTPTPPSKVPQPVRWLAVAICLMVGCIGVVFLIPQGEFAGMLRVGLIVCALAVLPGLLAGAFNEFARGTGRCLGQLWGSIRGR